MKILVLLKQTFDTEEKITLENGNVSEQGVEFIINPYDEYAVEEAVKLKEELGAEVTLLTVGPSRTETAIRTALAMGVDKAVQIEHDGSEADEYVISNIIAATVKNQAFDLILGGNTAVDSGAGQIAIRVAEILGIPHVATITKLSIDGRKATVERDVEGDLETIEVELPFLATAQQGLNEPRYPSLPGIMKAKKKPIEHLDVNELDISKTDLCAKTEVLDQYLPSKKQAGRTLTGEMANQVSELVQLLRTNAKVL
ncbi:electron transfer flavoprotein subunit beta/FixA family protein [Metabacillus rhizolycopersici]|uniref:Electron transfer flavoprotein subunit beta n=1 Tax=Metabacillus rhizolycopersici TaxID=2875709 RepID=A0ABS7UXB0_9BACI|nr:electron transfer flavoprotein subunit beta/FixA family protein [Metabacillus rhizolycopersici]MBZ5752960.1 electron transfer flavoprotein subunit beta/FixA family protein [Metabacillus rhizolycopersici]